MNNCPDCATAKNDPNSGRYQSSCDDCRARRLSKSPQFWQSQRDGFIGADYKRDLVAIFGQERYLEGHVIVKAFAEKGP